MKTIFKIIFIFLFTFFYTKGIENDSIWFKNELNTENYNIMLTQDNEGFLLFGTTGGIMKYDGYSKAFITAGEDSIAANLVPSIFVDSDGLIWIATWNGLNLYNKENNKYRYFNVNNSSENSISSNKFNWAPKLIAEDLDGDIWIATQYGLNSYNKKTNKFLNYKKTQNIWTITVDSKNNIWFGTQDEGLFKYNKKDNKFQNFKHDSAKPLSSIGKGIVYAILEGRDGIIWIGTSEGGLSKLDPKTLNIDVYQHNSNKSNTIASNEVFSLMEDRNNNIWIGRNYTSSIGIEIFNPKLNTFKIYSKKAGNGLSGNNYMTSFEDKHGTIWLPDNLGNIDKFDFKNPQFIFLDKTKTFLSIYEDNENNIWFGTQTEGLIKYSNKTFINYSPVDSNPNSVSMKYIFSILEDNNKELWFSTGDGKLSVFNRKTEEVDRRYQNPIVKTAARGLIQDKFNKDIFWFGTEGDGFFKFNKNTGKFKQYKNILGDNSSISNNLIQNLFQDEKGNIWIPTHGGGLNKLIRDSEKFISYKYEKNNPKSISGNIVFDCFIDSKGRFWITTDSGGLNEFFPEKEEFKRYGVNNGFKTNALRSIEEDNHGYLWITSNNGLYKFDPDKEEVLSIYSEKDGLAGDQFSFFVTATTKLNDGSIIVTTNKGTNQFYPEKLVKNNFHPPVVLTSLSHNGEALVPDKAPEVIKEITLKWPDSSFTFEYAALNYTLPEKSIYKYILEGYDTEWYEAGNRRFGRYSKLPGGNYTLKIKGTNNDGIWSDKEAILNVTIIPPYWQTWEFKIFMGILFISITILIAYLRTKNVQERNKKLEKLVNIRTKELNEKQEELVEKNIKLIDSIEYAKKIQEVTLPAEEEFRKYFQDIMLIYKAKDIVSGDFYWLEKLGDDIFIIVADCTGHGVPGALLASIGNMLLDKNILVEKLTDLPSILEKMDEDIKKLLSTENSESFDGMDLSICKINSINQTISFAGARGQLLYSTKYNTLERIKGTKRSLGGRSRRFKRDFEVTNLNLQVIDSLYFFSDGYPDQLNEDGISMNTNTFIDLINSVKFYSFEEQEALINDFYNQYRNSKEQTDDITILGIKL